MRIPNRRKTTISFTSFSSPETSFAKVSLVSFFVFSNEAVDKISIELWEKDYCGKRVRKFWKQLSCQNQSSLKASILIFFDHFIIYKHLYINMRGISLTNKKVDKTGGIVSHRRRQYLCSLDLENICKKILWCQRSMFFAKSKVCSKHDERKLFVFLYQQVQVTRVVILAPLGPDQSERSKFFLDQSESRISPMWLIDVTFAHIWAWFYTWPHEIKNTHTRVESAFLT